MMKRISGGILFLSPGVNLEMNQKGEVIGIEILNASQVLKDIVEPLREKAAASLR
ncbi:MAG: DUF2283 domain-containing protein [Candidatus Aminicenantales bacterium]